MTNSIIYVKNLNINQFLNDLIAYFTLFKVCKGEVLNGVLCFL
ncbi:hypothetical protein CWATWH0402_2199 [Crocosphaera watsonii WH 0402]|uniref:Uncharacterized protein n=1 Tax=Crocosphaera watsonii WH 0402 TaxID=1284629 RepID=T2JZ54_CROWT|nr:hypothetical protein CWATWH0402_2199 [Crocosphaera watsonii WH 0402]